MRKFYAVLLILCASYCADAQYQVNGSALASPSPGFPTEFQLVPPPPSDHVAGSVFSTNAIDLKKDFVLNAQFYFGTEDENGGDGIALVFQNEGPSYLGNYGAGIGYHRFDTDVPGPVPSFIVEFDTYHNDWVAVGDIADPIGDHIGFMSNSNAYHSNAATNLAPAFELSANVEDGQWHPVSFSWNASSKSLTVTIATTPTSIQTVTYSGDVVANIFSGNGSVLWGFTAATGHASQEHRVRILDFRNGPAVAPLDATGTVINAACRGGSIDLTVTGGLAPYTYLWSNGTTTANLTNVPAGPYTVAVTDALGTQVQKQFTIGNDGCATTPLSITAVLTNASCSPNGAIDITVAGGKAPYTYSWSNGQTTSDLKNLSAGTYTVTVKDAAGNTKQASFKLINGPDVTAPEINAPATVTQCYSLLLNYYSIPAITATDNCGLGTYTYTITGATSRSGSGKNASGSFNPGVSTITWKVKDNAGNVATATTIVNITRVTVSIPDVYTVSPGGKANTIYIGFGATSATLKANVSGGTAPYKYLWSTGATTPTINVSGARAGTYSYFVLVQDAAGCTSYMLKQVKVVDVRCDKNKVMVCHIPGGNIRKANELCVSKNAVDAHLLHGDMLGSCDDDDNDKDKDKDHDRSISITKAATESTTATSTVYPNPTRGGVDIRMSKVSAGRVDVLVMNGNGVVVERKQVQVTAKLQTLHLDLTGRAAGVYVVKIVSAGGTQTEKIIVQR